MGGYKQLFLLYKEAKEQPVDPQILMLCRLGGYAPLDVVLAQFKYLVNHKLYNQDYTCMREYLTKVFGKQIIDDMEAM